MPESYAVIPIDFNEGGVTSLELRLDRAVRSGSGQVFGTPSDATNEKLGECVQGDELLGEDGVMLCEASDFDMSFGSVPLADVGFEVEIGPLFQTAEETADAAIQKNEQMVGVSSLTATI